MAITSVRFESIGDHIDIKIGLHCRASLTVLEEELLLDWLLQRQTERAPGLRTELPSPYHLDLPARNGA